jgi:hypothetical protein
MVFGVGRKGRANPSERTGLFSENPLSMIVSKKEGKNRAFDRLTSALKNNPASDSIPSG